jgi:hypothetical protein
MSSSGPDRKVTTIERDGKIIRTETITTVTTKDDIAHSRVATTPVESTEQSRTEGTKADAPKMTVESFLLKPWDSNSCHPKVKKVIQFFQTYDRPKKEMIIQETNTAIEKTMNWFESKDEYLLSDSEAIRLWNEMPETCRRFWNKMQKLKGEPLFHSARSGQKMPEGMVVVPVESGSGHDYEVNLPHFTSGIDMELFRWESTKRTRQDVRFDQIREPTYHEVVAVVTAKHLYD